MVEKKALGGLVMGMCVFLLGIGLLLLTFKFAYDTFSRPVSQTLGMQQGQPLNFNKAGDSLATLVVRVIMLVFMALLGSITANRGIKMYSEAHIASRSDG